MPSPEKANRKQFAVIWEKARIPTNSGEPQVYSPLEIRVKWEDVKRQTLAPDNTVTGVDVVLILGDSYEVGSIVWKGELDDVPEPPTELYELIGLEDTSDIKGRDHQYTGLLKKFNNTLPNLVGTGS